MPRLSVLIPAHNARRHIRAAVRSVLVDLPADSEVVVLDDASTDRTGRAVERIRDPRVRLVRAEQNLGAAGAMKELLAQTDSEIVARLDADDLSAPGRFAAQQAELDTGIDVSFGNLRHFGRRYRGAKTGTDVRLSVDGVRLALLRGNPLGQSTLYAKRLAFSEASYPQCATEDYATWLDMAARGVRIVLSDQIFASYRHHGRQLTGTVKWKDQRWNEQVVVRSAYNRLSDAVLGITPTDGHPIWGVWGPDSDADQAVVQAIRDRLGDFSGSEGAHLRLIFG